MSEFLIFAHFLFFGERYRSFPLINVSKSLILLKSNEQLGKKRVIRSEIK